MEFASVEHLRCQHDPQKKLILQDMAHLYAGSGLLHGNLLDGLVEWDGEVVVAALSVLQMSFLADRNHAVYTLVQLETRGFRYYGVGGGRCLCHEFAYVHLESSPLHRNAHINVVETSAPQFLVLQIES